MSIADLVRTVTARREAMYQYASGYDRLCEAEQLALLEGREIEAAGYQRLAAYALRAYRAEINDPAPRRVP